MAEFANLALVQANALPAEAEDSIGLIAEFIQAVIQEPLLIVVPAAEAVNVVYAMAMDTYDKTSSPLIIHNKRGRVKSHFGSVSVFR